MLGNVPEEIGRQFTEQSEMRLLMDFLSEHGLPVALTPLLYKRLHDTLCHRRCSKRSAAPCHARSNILFRPTSHRPNLSFQIGYVLPCRHVLGDVLSLSAADFDKCNQQTGKILPPHAQCRADQVFADGIAAVAVQRQLRRAVQPQQPCSVYLSEQLCYTIY